MKGRRSHERLPDPESPLVAERWELSVRETQARAAAQGKLSKKELRQLAMAELALEEPTDNLRGLKQAWKKLEKTERQLLAHLALLKLPGDVPEEMFSKLKV